MQQQLMVVFFFVCYACSAEAFRKKKPSDDDDQLKDSVSTVLKIAEKTNTTLPTAFLQMLQQSNGTVESAAQEALARMEACGEACVDPVSDEKLMEAAVEAAKLVIGVVGEMTKYVLKELQAAREEIARWSSKITELAEVDITDYTIKVARATTALNQNEAKARALYRNMLDLTEIIVEDLESNFADPSSEKQEQACRDAQEAMTVALESAIEDLEALIPKTAEVATTFAEISALSQNFENKIRDNINNKDGWIDAKEAELRGIVYGSCGASCIIMPPACAVCFAVGAPILETKLGELRADMEAAKSAMHSIANRFATLKTNSEKLGGAAGTSHDNMVDVNTKMKQSAKLVNRKISLRFWQVYILRDIKKLNELLSEKLT